MASRYAVSRPVREITSAVASKAPCPPRDCSRVGCIATHLESRGEHNIRVPDAPRHPKEAAVWFVVVLDHGRERVLRACDALDAHGNPLHGYEFVKWLARCAECYLEEADRAGTSARVYVQNLPDAA